MSWVLWITSAQGEIPIAGMGDTSSSLADSSLGTRDTLTSTWKNPFFLWIKVALEVQISGNWPAVPRRVVASTGGAPPEPAASWGRPALGLRGSQHADFLVAHADFLVVARMRDLVPWPGIEPRHPALGAQSLTHWTTREVPIKYLYSRCFLSTCGLSFHSFNRVFWKTEVLHFDEVQSQLVLLWIKLLVLQLINL